MADDTPDLEHNMYRVLLYLYPAEFRREYGEHMAQVFEDLRNEHDPASGSSCWVT